MSFPNRDRLPSIGNQVGQVMPNHPDVVKFGVFEVDLKAGEVRKAGVRQKLAGQPFQVLQLLLEHPQEIVTREELRERLWPGNTFVDYELALRKAINRLREVLGDSAENPHFIETIPRRGYRFLAALNPPLPGSPVSSPATTNEQLLAAQTSPTRPVLWQRIAIGAAVVVALAAVAWAVGAIGRYRVRAGSSHASIRSIAVLPLVNLSNSPEQEYFADGMTDELITTLAKISELRVTSRTSVVRYRSQQKPIAQIAKELGVDAIIEGTVLRSGNRVRITTQLIDAATDRHLWAETYERNLGDILSVQAEVGRDVAEEVEVKLTARERASLTTARIVNPEAYELYLKGRYFWNRRTEEGARKSIDYFRHAIAVDPHYALAHAGLADSYLVLAGYRLVSPNEALPLAKAAALKAVELDDSLAEAHTPLAVFRVEYDVDLPGAEKEFKRAIELNPSYATARQWYGEEVLAATGRFAEALVELRRAEQLDPLSLAINTVHGYVLYLARDNDGAIAQLRKTLDLDENFPVAHMFLGRVFAQKRMYANAITEFQEAYALSGGEPFYQAWLAYGYAVSGQPRQAEKVLKEMQHLARSKYLPPYDMAAIWTALGQRDHALELLKKARDDHAAYFPAINVEPVFDNLHSDPRFQGLVLRIGLPMN